MITHRVAGASLDFAALRSELEVPGDFDVAVLAEAERATHQVVLPDNDQTAVPLVTVDPLGSMDLDQAMHMERSAGGYTVRYAIADVAAFVVPGGALDKQTHARGETLYFPDTRVPLHPPHLSEGAASLLPDQTRPAALWQIALGDDGDVTGIDVRRARVRSVARLDYVSVQRAADADRLHPSIALLPEIGQRRLALSRRRHAINLDLPEQIVVADGPGRYALAMRAPLAVERYNAEISLLTGMCAATLMLRGGYGLLRVVPPPDPKAVDALKAAAAALGVSWPPNAPPGDVLATLDRRNPRHVAFIEHALALLRGSTYVAFNGTPPRVHEHSGIGAAYAHVTAPLRRLVDRYASEICLSLCADVAVPMWVRATAPAVPELMSAADHRAHAVDRAVVDMTEAWLLRDRIGHQFAAVVIDADDRGGTVVLDDPAVRARCSGSGLTIGQRIAATLVAADVATRTVTFERAA